MRKAIFGVGPKIIVAFVFIGIVAVLATVGVDKAIASVLGQGNELTGSCYVKVYSGSDFKMDVGKEPETFRNSVPNLGKVEGPCWPDQAEPKKNSWWGCISSLRIPKGCEAVVYSKTGYQGKSKAFSSDQEDLSKVSGPAACQNNWDQCIKSFTLRKSGG
ncbi:MAG: hypothetical protein SVS85_00770 [Candidatus Nanohaloarchaea archaeon]|nr:hypothetical protein [Candidatus Nanohaloarchaea archaeon]